MPTKIGIANALSSKDFAQVSRLLTANSKKSRFTPEERKQLEAHKNTLRKPRGKAASAAPNASAPASANASAPASAPANASAPAPPASKAPSKAAESRAAGQMSRLANVQSRFSANGSYTGKTRKGNATKLKGLLALKKDPFDAETRSKVEKMLADLEAAPPKAAPPKAPVLSAVAESNESSNESSAKKYFDPTTGAPMEEEAFFKMLKDSGLCKEATKRSTAKKAKNKKSANRAALKKGRANFSKEYYSRKGPIGASLESQSASS